MSLRPCEVWASLVRFNVQWQTFSCRLAFWLKKLHRSKWLKMNSPMTFDTNHIKLQQQNLGCPQKNIGCYLPCFWCYVCCSLLRESWYGTMHWHIGPFHWVNTWHSCASQYSEPMIANLTKVLCSTLWCLRFKYFTFYMALYLMHYTM